MNTFHTVVHQYFPISMGEAWFLGLGANTWRAREREPITSSLPGAEPLVGRHWRSPLKLKAFLKL